MRSRGILPPIHIHSSFYRPSHTTPAVQVLHSDHIVFGPITHRFKSMAQDPASWLRNSSSCDTDCMWLLRHVVSHHASVNGDYG